MCGQIEKSGDTGSQQFIGEVYDGPAEGQPKQVIIVPRIHVPIRNGLTMHYG